MFNLTSDQDIETGLYMVEVTLSDDYVNETYILEIYMDEGIEEENEV